MQTAIIFAIGLIIGCLISAIIRRVKSIGALRIDTSDPDGPYMFLELDKGVDTISSKKYVLLRVKLRNYIPHK